MKKLGIILLMALGFSCEEPVPVELPNAERVLVFDAWIYHKAERQEIRISQSNTYFDNSAPTGIEGASVRILDEDGTEFIFTEDPDTTGVYFWLPANPTDSFGTIGKRYFLDVSIEGNRYGAASQLNDVPPVDSINWTLEEGLFGEDDEYVAEFWASDLPGQGDAYWIKSWRNGVYLNKPSEITIAFDAGFSPGGGADQDGKTFISPIRTSVNRDEVDANDEPVPDWTEFGEDSLYVEINSITLEAWFFWQQVAIQTDRPGGVGELFAESPANVGSNIVAENGDQVVGFFCTSAAKGLGRTFTEDAIFEDKTQD